LMRNGETDALRSGRSAMQGRPVVSAGFCHQRDGLGRERWPRDCTHRES
jgi:hypothetical protein